MEQLDTIKKIFDIIHHTKTIENLSVIIHRISRRNEFDNGFREKIALIASGPVSDFAKLNFKAALMQLN